MKLRYALTTTFILLLLKGYSSFTTKASIGYGHYDASFAGIELSSPKHGLQFGVGYNFGLSKTSYSSMHLNYFRKIKTFSDGNNAIGYYAKATYWQQKDSYYEWKNMGIGLGVNTFYGILPQITLEGKLGLINNYNLSNEMRSLERVGWIKPIDIDFQLTLSYEL